jgi:hypothetical protein
VGLLDGGLRETRVASLDPPTFAPFAAPRAAQMGVLQAFVLQAFVLRGPEEVIAVTWTRRG